MKRVNVLYGGAQYAARAEDYEQLKSRIAEAVESGKPGWIRVNRGEGRPTPAELLVGPGIPIALVTLPTDDEVPAEEE